MPWVHVYYAPSVEREDLIAASLGLREEVARRFSAVTGASQIVPDFVRVITHQTDTEVDVIPADLAVVIFTEYNSARANARVALQGELRSFLRVLLRDACTVHVWIAMVGEQPRPPERRYR